MRQVLIRLRLDTLFTTESVAGIPYLGIGWLLLPWTALTLWWLLVAKRKGTLALERRPLVISYLVGIGVLAAVRVLSQGGEPGPFLPIFGYGCLVFVGCLLAYQTGAWRARREGMPEGLAWSLAVWIFMGGLVGARGWYVIQYPGKVFADHPTLPGKLAAIIDISTGGLVLYGGIALALAGIVTCAWQHRDACNPLRTGDLVIPSFFLALAFGRLGCLMNGCCFGDACELPWAIYFPNGSVPFSVLVSRGYLDRTAAVTYGLHPSQVYSSLNGLVLSLVTATAFRYSRKPGETLAIGLVAYPITRLVLEVLRDDELGQFGTGLTISQCFSLLLLAVGLAFAAWIWKQPNPQLAPTPPPT